MIAACLSTICSDLTIHWMARDSVKGRISGENDQLRIVPAAFVNMIPLLLV